MLRARHVIILLVSLGVPEILTTDAGSRNPQWRNPKDGMEFVWVPPGSFMAQETQDQNKTEKPTLRTVNLPDGFWMGRTEVTVKQFHHFVEQTGYVTEAEKAGNAFNWRIPGFKQAGNHPVVYLSKQDALRYADWAGVDLPTEAEWVYACRAGTTTRYYWGDEVDARYLWYRENSGDGTRPVAHKLPNAWGLYDMVGNAWEYCRVCGTFIVQRGGSWTRCPKYRTRQGFVAENLLGETVEPRLWNCESSGQYFSYPWDDDRGFRCVKRVKPEEER